MLYTYMWAHVRVSRDKCQPFVFRQEASELHIGSINSGR